MHKRRTQPRLKFGIIVKDKKSKRKGKTRNISVDGCFIEKRDGFDELLPVGSSIELILDLPNAEKKIKATGIVKHHGTHNDGMGVYFELIDKESVLLIDQFIQTFIDDLSEEYAEIKKEYHEEVGRLRDKSHHGEE